MFISYLYNGSSQGNDNYNKLELRKNLELALNDGV